MQRIFRSTAVIAGALVVMIAGGTSAFFSDTEVSSGNTFTSGSIDLTVDNESYYNGLFNEGTSWEPVDLDSGVFRFFDFDDLKPGDYGEDTISLHVATNDAYLCGSVTLTSNNDNTPTEPELEVDATTGDGQGELAGLVNFIWWADDGDNVLETDEELLSPPGAIGSLPLNTPYPLAFADSDENIWDGEAPVNGNTPYYIGKAWCFGTLTPAPLPQENYDSPAGDNNENDTAGEPEDGGYSCDGSLLGNESQTDSLTADIAFSAVQARHNSEFQCDEPEVVCIPGEENVFANGGFETPEVTNGAKWELFLANISSWTVEWRPGLPTTFASFTRPEPGNFELHEGVLGVAFEGDQYIELDSDWNGTAAGPNGEPASTVISQTIATVPGDTYTVSYAFAPRPNTPAADNHVEVRWDGNLLHTAGPMAGGGSNLTAGDWIPYGPFQFVATDNSTVISFTDVGTANSLGSFIDDVVVTRAVCTLGPNN